MIGCHATHLTGYLQNEVLILPRYIRPLTAAGGFLTLLILLALLAAIPATGQEPDPCDLGRSLYREGRAAEARNALLRCLATGTEEVDVLLPLAVMGVREGRIDEGIEYAGRAVSVAPDDPEARYWYGRALLRDNQPDAARAQWEAGLQLTFEHAGILEGLARLALTEGESAKAYNLLTQLQRNGVDEAWIHRLLADIAAGKGLWAQSLGHLEDAMVREPNQLDDLLAASELAILSGRKGMAVGYGRQAVALSPETRSWGGLGEAYFALEEVDSALVYLRLAVQDSTASPRYRFNLANALEVAGLFEEADEHFSTYVELMPEDPVGRFNYGVHLDSAGRTDDALVQLAAAVALDPNMLSAYVVLAQVLENAGRIDEALSAVEELQDRDRHNAPELATWHARLSDLRDGADQKRAAGLVHLLHMVLGTQELVDRVTAELEAGEDFASLAVRFSTGTAASKGGDIGWIDPQSMVEPLRAAIGALAENETSPPIESRGLYHIFKRIR